MCKILIFGCTAAVILMTTAYGAPLEKTTLSPTTKEEALILQALISDLALLKDIDNVSGDFLLSQDSFVFVFFYVIFSEKLTFPPPSLQNFLDFYTPNDKRVSVNSLFSFNSI